MASYYSRSSPFPQHLRLGNGPLSHEPVVDGMYPALVHHPDPFLRHIHHSLYRSGSMIFLSKKPFSDIFMMQLEIPITLPKKSEIALLASMPIGFHCLYTLLHHVPCFLNAYPYFHWPYLMLQSCSALTSISSSLLAFLRFFRQKRC